MTSHPKIYLAPFQGITTYTYREVYTKHFGGVDKLFTPFFTGIHKTKSLEKRAYELNFTHHNKVDVVPQILSKDADEIIHFANYCNNKGIKEINWNLGCPYPRVANKKRGSGMLPYPEMVKEILEKIMPEININFSIKCRLGYFSEDEILELMDVFNSYDISELTIHARIGKQLYAGEVKKDAFKKAVEKSRINIVYNGDIFTVTDFNKFKNEFETINRWMIGRGLLVDPFLPAKIKNEQVPELSEQKEIAYKFITDIYLGYRKKTNNGLQAIGVLKELWGFLAFSFNDPQKAFNGIKKTISLEKYEEVVASVFHEFDWVGSEAGLFGIHLQKDLTK
ncbi:MAG: tRNA-dihydrouridine synthase family protein [Bacteroidetes bacterium]|nr:tRNA-dihydrouridine synthase family protein [Bacteroidota bacterium]MBL6943375.1 tRNA-dihydrouridine synthase family protein [Bacteroidales bacterium]